VWGVWLGLGGFLGLAPNADSFASLFALGFFGFFAWMGLFAGMALGALIGGLLERLLLRLGAGMAVALGLATLANALALWQIADFVQHEFPGLRAPAAQRPLPSSRALSPKDSCAQPPPAQSKERKAWDTECR
jgi:predicted lipid-binding transport protein (Tim44 family)